MNSKTAKIGLFIILLVLTKWSYGQGYDFFDFWGKGRGSVSGVASLPEYNINASLTPYTNVWLYYPGAPIARGQFMRCLGTLDAQYGLKAYSATTDTLILTFRIYFAYTGNTTIMGTGNWVITQENIATNTAKLKFLTNGGTAVIDTIRTTDSTAWRSYVIKANKPDSRLKVWRNDTLIYDAAYTYTVNANSFAFALGNWYGTNSVADTNQQNSDGYLRGGLSSFSLRRYSGTVDTLYSLWLPGYGQNAYFNTYANGVLIKSRYEYDRADYNDQFPASIHLELGCSPAPDTKDPVWQYTGTAPTYIKTLGGGVAYFDSSSGNWLMTERFTNGECLYKVGDSTWIVVGGRINQINWTSTRTPGQSSTGISKYNINTEKWSPFNNSQYPTGSIYGLTQWDTSLIAIGDMTSFNGVSLATYIARWDGTNWNALDSGFNGTGLRVRNIDDTLYGLGAFTKSGNTTLNGAGRIARGGQWRAFGTGLDNTGYDICKYNGSLYIGGVFGNANGVACNGFGKWTGSTFQGYGTGVKTASGNGVIFCMKVYKGELYIGGQFDSLGGVACKNFGKFNGTTFSPVFSITQGSTSLAAVVDMEVDSVYNQLWVCGHMSKVDNTDVGMWFVTDGTTFKALPPADMKMEGIVIANNNTPNIRYFGMGDAESVYGVNVGCVWETLRP